MIFYRIKSRKKDIYLFFLIDLKTGMKTNAAEMISITMVMPSIRSAFVKTR